MKDYKTKYGDISINIIGLKEPVKSKKLVGRKQDELDLEILTNLTKQKNNSDI